jgi:predicted RNA-binding Zn ribbon-like protein
MGLAPANEPDVRLVRDFVNTLDVEAGTDELASASGLTAWLRERDLLDGQEHSDQADLTLARELREGLRAELRSHHGAPPDAAARRGLDAAAAQLPLQVAFGTETPALAPADTGPRAGLAAVLAAVAALARTGEWRRLKVCPADDCQWAFYDESRNRSRRWCSMEVCGNRAKLRAFRDRQPGTPAAPDAPATPGVHTRPVQARPR